MPDIACFFVPSDGRRSYSQKREEGKVRANQKCGEIRNNGSITFMHHSSVPLFSFYIWSARKIGFHPGISLVELVDSAGRRPSPVGPPWSTRTPWERVGWWWRLWRPAQSIVSSPQSSWADFWRFTRMGRPCPRISARAGGSTPSWHSLRQGCTTYPAWSRCLL